jgi:hypothetical protein
MDMVGHQPIGVYGTGVLLSGVLETCEVKAVVIVGKEDGLAIIASLDDMLRDVRNRIAGLPRHEPSPGERDHV